MESKRRIVVVEIVRWTIHVGAVVGILATGVSLVAMIVCAITYVSGMLALSLVYHRYFSHRVFKTSRWFQFVLAIWGCMSLQRGPIWWAFVHRHHHRHSDTDEDFHSPRQSFWHAHLGWLTSPKIYDVDYVKLKDLSRYPELMWLERWYHLPSLVLIAALAALGHYLESAYPELGTSALQMVVWGFFVRTVLLWHATFFINSLMHMIGTQRFATDDDSRNSLMLALLTMGEGWHNNHHRMPASARAGFYWWEVDCSYYCIKLFQRLGLVWDVVEVPERILEEGRKGLPASEA